MFPNTKFTTSQGESDHGPQYLFQPKKALSSEAVELSFGTAVEADINNISAFSGDLVRFELHEFLMRAAAAAIVAPTGPPQKENLVVPDARFRATQMAFWL